MSGRFRSYLCEVTVEFGGLKWVWMCCDGLLFCWMYLVCVSVIVLVRSIDDK